MANRIGPYRVEQRLGKGGMGEVFRGYDERLDRPVALKRVKGGSGDDRDARSRFRREARLAARLSHPTIVQIYDLVETEEGDWIVMELVEGRSLVELTAHGPLASGSAVRIVKEIATGLVVAHRAGVVHRDLKLDNVMVGAGGEVKILDFGIAKRLPGLGEPATTTLSVDGQLLGTVTAMSPEQAMGQTLDHRSDLFSLGTLCYELLTGIPPFRGQNTVETLTRICTLRQTPLRQRNPWVPEALSTLVDRLLEKEPARRPQSARDVVRALQRIDQEHRPPREVHDDEPLSRPQLEVTRHTGLTDPQARVEESPEGPPTQDPFYEATLEEDSQAKSSRRIAAVRGRRRWVLTLLPLFLALGTLGVWRWLQPRKPLVVAVAAPQVVSQDPAVETALMALALRDAVSRALLSLEGISPRVPEPGDEGGGGPVKLAQAMAADEVVTSQIACEVLNCRLTLNRVDGADGALIWTRSSQVLGTELSLFTDVVQQRMRQGYPAAELRSGVVALEARDRDYKEYLRLRQAFYYRSEDLPTSELLAGLQSIRTTSPSFLEAYLLEATVARHRFKTSRDPADLDRTFHTIEAARRLAPRDPRPLSALAMAALDGQEPQRMAAALDELERLDAGNPQLLTLRGWWLQLEGQGHEAIETMRQAVRHQPSLKNLFDLSLVEFSNGQIQAAREHLQELLERRPGHFDGRSMLAQLELANGSAEAAAELYETLVSDSPGTPESTNLGLAYMLLGRYQEAARAFRRVVEQEPHNASALLNLADTEWLLGEEEVARKRYLQILHLLDADGAASGWRELVIRAQSLAHLNRSRPAVAAAQRALQLAPNNQQVTYSAALVYTLVGERASALVNVERALKQGMEPRWFTFPWFNSLRSDGDFQSLVERSPQE